MEAGFLLNLIAWCAVAALILAIIAALLGLVIGNRRHVNVAPYIFLGFCILVTVGFILAPFIRIVPAWTTVYDSNMNIMDNTRENNKQVWFRDARWQGRFDNRVWWVNYNGKVVQLTHVFKVSDGISNRNLRFGVKLWAMGDPESGLAYHRHIHSQPNWTNENDWLKSEYYKLGIEMKHTFSQFTNPLDQDQQIQFRRMMREYFQTRLDHAGVKLITSWFSID